MNATAPGVVADSICTKTTDISVEISTSFP